jgi:hypothetical protein
MLYADLLNHTLPNHEATRVTRHWTLKDDTKLTREVANTFKQKRGKEYKTNCPAISAMVPGRTRHHRCNRWLHTLHPSRVLTAGRMGKWKEDEDSNLKDSVQTHGDKVGP